MSEAEGRRRARHIVRASTRRRITIVDRVGRLISSVSPGELERRPQVWFAAVCAGIVALAALLVRLFVPTVVGVGDVGDGFRLLCNLGLGNVRPFSANPALAIYPVWQPTTWYGLACPASDAAPFSAYHLLVAVARVLSLPFGGGLDLRVLGVLLAVLVALLIIALVRYLPGSVPFRLVVAGLILVVLLDSSFVNFFISADAEGTVFVAVLAAFVALLILWGGYADRVTTLDVPPRGVLALTLAVVIAALVVSTGPVGLAFLPGFVAGLLLVPRLRDAELDRARVTGRAVRGDKSREAVRKFSRRLPAVIACAALLAVGVFQFAFAASRDSREDVYSTVFLTILPKSPTPAADLEWFGLNEGAQAAIGQPVTSSAAADVFASSGFASVTSSDVLFFHLAHLERIVMLADSGMAALASPLLESRGNAMTERVNDDGVVEHDRRWIPVQWGSEVLYSVPLLIPASQIAGILIALALAFSHKSSLRNRSLGWATFFLLIGSSLIFWSTILGAHTSLAESLLPSTLVLWLSGPLIIACVAVRFASSGSGAKSPDLAPKPKYSRIAEVTRSAAPPSP